MGNIQGHIPSNCPFRMPMWTEM